MGRLAKRIGDGRVLGLIRGYLKAGIMANGLAMERYEGTPQGGPLSPLLANVLLDEVDKELEKRGHAFVRYADDGNVYVRSRRAGERVMELLRRLYAKLRLRVNESKSAVDLATRRRLLGYSFWVAPGRVVKRRVSAKTLAALKDKVRSITRRTGGRSIEQVVEELGGYLAGWKQYYRLADTPRVFAQLDEWLRHRLRAVHLKHWKRGKTIYRELRRRGSPATQRPGWRPTVGAGGTTRPWSLTLPFLSATSTSWGCPGSPRDLNLSNRPVRTRMPGGVAGEP